MPLYMDRPMRVIVFQSAPAIAGGRCSVSTPITPGAVGFNPRPPLLAGDALQILQAMDASLRFQSAPAIAGGRCTL